VLQFPFVGVARRWRVNNPQVRGAINLLSVIMLQFTGVGLGVDVARRLRRIVAEGYGDQLGDVFRRRHLAMGGRGRVAG
jgi:hypothetical protein